MQICWICNADASSSEHRAKASDVRQVFGEVSEKSPLFTTNDYGKPQVVKSISAARFKFNKPICARCNNQRTQPHDRAWEKLSRYIDSGHKQGKWLKIIRLDDLTEYPSEFMLDIHLYFTKLFGCQINDSEAPIPLTEFAKAIVLGQQNKKMSLSFSETEPFDSPHIHLSQIQAVLVDGIVDRAICIYAINRILVSMFYAQHGGFPRGEKEAWKPSTVRKQIKFKYEPLESDRIIELRSGGAT
jgi:hypothetical protein